MTDLGDFGVERSDPPIRIKKRGRILVNHKDEVRTAGWWGPTNRDGKDGFVSERTKDDHEVWSWSAYAISDSALRKLEAVGVEVVIVIEADTGRVYEWTLDQFTKYGEALPDKWLDDIRDPQTAARKSKAVHVWPDHAGGVYVPRDADPEATHG